MESLQSNNQARNILGDEDKEAAASKAVEELNLINPEEKQPTVKRGRKPKQQQVIPPENTQPTPAQQNLGATLVETQAICLTGIVAMFSTGESASEIYKLHTEKHREKLSNAYAMCIKEMGIEVTGKMVAIGMLATAQVNLLRDCWDAWEPKNEDEQLEQ